MASSRPLFFLASVLGFLGVALGAFGAHGLTARLGPLADGAARLEWWKTGAHYHLLHAVAIGLAASLSATREGRGANVAAIAFSVGVVLFSGSLYLMTVTGIRALGAITPLGGLAFLVGWAALGVGGLRP